MKKERIRSKHGFKGFGVFILGWFIGLISTLGILFGVGYWAYTSISVKRIEKWTKSDITDNQGLESLTLKKAVGIISSISSSNNAYTIAKMEEDFNIKLLDDSIYGIKLDTLKNSAINNLSNAIDTTINNITFNNVLNFMDINSDDLGLLDAVLNTQYTYYIYNGKLYTNSEHSIEVGFNGYKINNDIVEFGNSTHTIASNTIKPRFRDLPLNYAVSVMEDATKNLQIYQILGFERTGEEGNYKYTDNKQPVSGLMSNIAGYTIDQLSDNEKFTSIKIYEVMGYKDLGNGEYIYIDDNNQEIKVTGAIKAIAGMTISDISKPDTINGLEIYKLLGYYKNGDKYYEKYENSAYSDEVTGVIRVIADKTIKDLSNPDLINNLQVWEVMGYEQRGEENNYTYWEGNEQVQGIMATLAEKKIGALDDAGAFNNVTVADAMGYYLNTEDGKYYATYDEANGYSNPVTGIYAHIADAKIGALSARINTLTVGQVLDKDIDETSGVIKALYGFTIEQLSNKETIDGIYIWQVMDYTKIAEGVYTYNDNGTIKTVKGAMSVLADKTIGNLSNPDTIGDLKVYQVLGYYENNGKYYSTYDATTGTYSNEVTGAIKAIAGKKVSELNSETTGINSITLGEILDIDETTTGVINALQGFKLGELEGKINELKIYQVLGYYENDGKYYITYNEETQTYSDQVTGIMGAIAGSTVNGIGGTIDTLKAVDVFGSDLPILKLFSEEELNGTGGHSALTVMQLPQAVVNKINHEDTTIGVLIDAEILKVTDDNGNPVEVSAYIKGLTISGLIKEVMKING